MSSSRPRPASPTPSSAPSSAPSSPRLAKRAPSSCQKCHTSMVSLSQLSVRKLCEFTTQSITMGEFEVFSSFYILEATLPISTLPSRSSAKLKLQVILPLSTNVSFYLLFMKLMKTIVAAAINFNGGGHLNHTIFWSNMAPPPLGGGVPSGPLADQINKVFFIFLL